MNRSYKPKAGVPKLNSDTPAIICMVSYSEVS